MKLLPTTRPDNKSSLMIEQISNIDKNEDHSMDYNPESHNISMIDG